MNSGIPAMWMRGGSSKGGYFLASDLPSNPKLRDKVLMKIMGSPDARQINGLGGANSLTSKVAIIKKSTQKGIDVDYLFLQVAVDKPLVFDVQNCGNILAGVAPFAIERGLVMANDPKTRVKIFMENTSQIATAVVQTPNNKVVYSGKCSIDGVPGTSAPIVIDFADTAGSVCGSLLPTGNRLDNIDGVELTMIDNGMPCVVMESKNFEITGYENCQTLDDNTKLKQKLESIRLQAGKMMNLGDVKLKTIPKMVLVSKAQKKGAIATRSFIPHNCHSAIGVFVAVSVASACLLKKTCAAKIAKIPEGNPKNISIEHPSGEITIISNTNEQGKIVSNGVLRTARKLFAGLVYTE